MIRFLMELCVYLCPFAVFTFVFCLISAVSLLVIVGACVLPNL